MGNSSKIRESARELPVSHDYDVLICGGGPAGIGAALSAARRGARTGIVEIHGCLGGVWTVGALAWILDHENKNGIIKEIIEAMASRGARGVLSDGTPSSAFDVEALKLLLEDMLLEAGVEIHLHTAVCAALRDPDGQRLTHVITESKSGRRAISARCFVDCTGDGDLAARAGCGFEVGHPETGNTQPMSMIILLAGLDPVAAQPFFRHAPDVPWGPPEQAFHAEILRGGVDASYAFASLFHVRDDLFICMSNHEYGVSGLVAEDRTAATLRSRRELHAQVDALRGLGGIWSDLRIVATGAQIGVREGRRIHGLYTVCEDDLRDGARHADAVCRVTFPIDVHATDPSTGKGIEERSFRAKPYDIPLRALIARDVNGLLMAGRCISGDFLAHSSYRVTGNAVALGEAAGAVAAIAATTERLPQDVSHREIT